MSTKYEVQYSEKLGRYLVAAKSLKAGEIIFSEEPFIIGPNTDSSLLCFNCYTPLVSKFNVCKGCVVAPVCPDDGCPESLLKKWHSTEECELFKNLKQTISLNPMTMVQNIGSLLVLRAILKKRSECHSWKEFMQLETHLEMRKGTALWDFYEKTAKFIQTLGLLEEDDKDLVQKVCGAIDVNSFEVRGLPIPAIGCGETLRGVYLKAALLAHDCLANTHMSIDDNNILICHASVDISKGDIIHYNYTDALKGTDIRQHHLLVGKYFHCSCSRCMDFTEEGTFMSSAICPECKTGYISKRTAEEWTCMECAKQFKHSDIQHKVQCCIAKLDAINKNDQKELEEYIRNVSLVLAPNHYLLLEAKQRLAGVLRDTINREPHITRKSIRRKLNLCQEILPVLEKIYPGISRIKAITLYEMHAAIVQLAKKMYDGREITESGFMNELLRAESCLKRSLEMLLIEPRNSPEGELCVKAMGEYRSLKTTLRKSADTLHEQEKSYSKVNQPVKNFTRLNL